MQTKPTAKYYIWYYIKQGCSSSSNVSGVRDYNNYIIVNTTSNALLLFTYNSEFQSLLRILS